MDDETAFMQLVLANAQGELSPLEIGIHALKWKQNGGGKRGGIAEYARRTHWERQTISDRTCAAEVYEAVKERSAGHPADLLNKFRQLRAIHAAEVLAEVYQEVVIAESTHAVVCSSRGARGCETRYSSNSFIG